MTSVHLATVVAQCSAESSSISGQNSMSASILATISSAGGGAVAKAKDDDY